MNSNITINIVEPGSPTPDPVVPNTGLFTSGIGGIEASIIVAVGIVIIIAIAVTILYLRKKKISLKPSKHISIILSILVIITSIATFTGLTLNSIYNHTNAKEGDLTVTTEDANLTIEVGDQPVFAVLPVQVTVEEATKAGYALTAYTDNTDLVSTTNPSNKISMITVEGDELTTLTDNTWGLALDNEPTSKDNKVYTVLSTDQTNPTLITDKDYEETEANDTTTIYYGFYITPNLPVGTYINNNIVYDAISNLATISYDANGLYYNNDDTFTTNTLGYKPTTSESPISLVTGEYLSPAPITTTPAINYTLLGWSEDKEATTPTYVDENDIITNFTLHPNETRTLYAVWHYNTILSFDGNDNDGGEEIENITIAANDAILLPQNTFTKTGYIFNGWNTVQNPTEDNSGTHYDDEANFTASEISENITLYAQWLNTTTISFNGNGSTSGNMDSITVIEGTPQNLPQNTFTKTNATFIEWNTEPDGTGDSYNNEVLFTATHTSSQSITLYAQWASTTITFNGNGSTSGSMNNFTIAAGATSTLPQNNFIRTSYVFNGWNTAQDGTGTSYNDGANFIAVSGTSQNITLYAQWKPTTTISFNGNGSTSGSMNAITITGGDTQSLPQNAYIRNGYNFVSWNTNQDGTGTSYDDKVNYTASLSNTDSIILYAIWEKRCEAGHICYYGNGADSTSNMDKVEQYTADLASTEKQVDLLASNFKREGYGFIGWSTDADAYVHYTDDDETNNPTIYGPNQTITAGDISAEGKRLYAIWAPAETNITMQGFDPNDNTYLSKPNGSVLALKDERDNEVYAVAKLADGNWWMIENLRLDNSEAKVSTTAEFSSQNTNNPSLPLTNVYGGATSNRLSASSNSWNTYAKRNESMLNTNNTANTTISPAFSHDFTSSYHKNFNDSINSYGNYYNWYSATAGNGKQEIDRDVTVVGDICPAGWQLPIGNQTTNNGSFSHLDTSMGGTGSGQGTIEASNRWRSFPNNFVYSGRWYGSSASDRGSYGYYWSSTAYNDGSAYQLTFYKDSVTPGKYSGSGYYGHSVRCLAPVQTTVTFDGNSNDRGEMPNQNIGSNTTASLNSNRFIKIGYKFIGWNTERDGSGTTYADGQDYSAGEGIANVTLYAQWEEGYDTFYIIYYGNGADSTSNMDKVEQYTADLTSTEKQVDLLASNFKREGYGFIGWSTDADAYVHYTDNDETNNPTIYGPNQTITVNPSASSSLILYAIWAPAETDVTMQTFNPGNEAYVSKENGFILALKDERDNEVYAVAKLADGNWWMIENLRLDNSEAKVSTTAEFSSQNTNNPSLPLTNVYGGATSNRLSASSNSWNTYAKRNESMLNTNNTANTTISPAFSQDFTSKPHNNDLNNNITSYGNYYNWYSVTAGNGNYEENPDVVPGDICPVGWRLPSLHTATKNGSFRNLDTSMGGNGIFQYGGNKGLTASNRWRSFPNNFVYSGYWYGSYADSRGRYGYYWSSGTGSTATQYASGLSFSNERLIPGGDEFDKAKGYSVRCLAPVQTTITFDGNSNDGGEMPNQNIGSNTTASLNSNRFIKIGYMFTGWNTEKDGSGTTYADGQEYATGHAPTNITLYAQWEERRNTFYIHYYGNGADSTSNMDKVEQYTADLASTEKQVDLLASNFKREGYGFAGWSTDQDAASKINNTGDDKPTIYGPNQMITVDPSASTKLNLYAVWVPAETDVTMQTFNPNSEPYASKQNGSVLALKDERDNEVYAVAKLADGNWWMIENLRLDNSEAKVSTTAEFSNQNTNNPSLPLTNVYGGATSNRLSASSNDWCHDFSSAGCYNQSKLNTDNTANTAISPAFSQDFTNKVHDWSTGSLGANVVSYGNYYNWYSATAGNGNYAKSSGNTTGDICPAGWQLPVGGQTEDNGSFSHLDTSMGGTGSGQSTIEASNRWRSFPNNFVYSGARYGSSASGRGSDGYYWTSTATNIYNTYTLRLYNDSVGTSSVNRYYGYSVRCVAPVE